MANSAFHDLTLSGHHPVPHHSASHHPTSHHSVSHHSVSHHSVSHHSVSLEEFAHAAHLHVVRIIPVVNARFTRFFFGGTCGRQFRRYPGGSHKKCHFREPCAA